MLPPTGGADAPLKGPVNSVAEGVTEAAGEAKGLAVVVAVVLATLAANGSSLYVDMKTARSPNALDLQPSGVHGAAPLLARPW